MNGSDDPGVDRSTLLSPPGAPDPSVSLLSFEGVGRTFPDGTTALAAVSFSLSAGEMLAIVGPSGCGKSTVLRLASGLDRPTAGRVSSAAAGSVAYVFQDATLLPWRTVQGNVELLGELEGLDKQERARLAREMIDLVGLGGFERHRPRSLSGGMRMRVSLARALTLRPRLFLFDEPFAAVDEMTRQHLNEELLRLFAHQRFAGVFVTHSVVEAVYLASRLLVMSPRPGRMITEFAIPFAFPRGPALRFQPSFYELCAKVAAALRGGGQ